MSAAPLRVVLTGASSGLGVALAHEIARRWPTARLLLVARRAEALDALIAQLPTTVQAQPAVLDVTDTPALQVAIGAFIQQQGGVDWVIANAGISAGTLVAEPDDRAAMARIMAVNWQAALDTLAPAIAPMVAARSGILVGVASVAGVRGMPGASAYSASKAALSRSLESLRVELRGTGVAVVTLAPGFIATPMTAANPFPMPFLMQPEAFARRAVRAIVAQRRWCVIPWPMAIVARLLALLPPALFDRLLAGRPTKPRGH